MNLQWYLVSAIAFTFFINNIWCVLDFDSDSCVQAHNDLRKKHVDTKEVNKSPELERAAKQYARRLRGTDTSIPIHPKRSIPRRKRRSLENGIDESIHLELWDGDITYPSSNDGWLVNLNRNSKVKIGRSIHKFCCSRFPHCPKEFFHGLSFPPSAKGIVNDMYKEEERYYDYGTGKSKTIYSHVNHFARIVWKNTTKVGCGQSLVNNIGCVFSVVLYQLEGGVGSEDEFMRNIGQPIITDGGNPTTLIVLVIFIVALIIGLIVLAYCCRHNIDEKYRQTVIEIDVLKAEQELETDSTAFWWVRPLVPKKKPTEEKAPAKTMYHPVKEKPSIDIVTTPLKPRPSLKNIPRPSLDAAAHQPQANVSQLVNRYRGMSMKRQDYVQMNFGNNPPVPPSRPPMFSSNDRGVALERRPSGKAAPPPPVPTNDNQQFRPKAPVNKPPSSVGPRVIPSRPSAPVTKPLVSKQPSLSDASPSFEKPKPVPRNVPAAPGRVTFDSEAGSGPSGSPQVKKPMVPPKKPLPTMLSDSGEKPLTVAEKRKLLEQGKFS